MTPDFTLLAIALILALVQIFWAAAARTRELGIKWNAGARDGVVPPPGPLAGRLIRAQANLFETLPLFAAAVIMAQVAGKAGDMTHLGAQLYVFGRIAYLPVYAFGIPYVRSLIWLASLIGLGLVIAALFI